MKLLLFGCGGVGCALIEMIQLTGLLQIKDVVIIDPRSMQDEPIVHKAITSGWAKHIQIEIVQNNLLSILTEHAIKGDLIVDVSYNIYFKPVIQYCLDNQIFYINTSMERWPVENEFILDTNDIYDRTLYHLHKVLENIKSKHSPTIVVEHGMNPGLISHFVKLGIKNVAKEVIQHAELKKIYTSVVQDLISAYNSNNFPLLAYILQLETVHCSENDTQIPKNKRKENEFMNTWGAYSFYGEGVDPVQLGYGTHEKKIRDSISPPKNSEQNQVFLPIRGVDLLFESYVPVQGGIIHGMVIPHGENDTIGRSLTLYKDGIPVYRPSNYYVYSPCTVAWDSIKAVQKNNYKMLDVQHPLRGNEIATGEDAVGALLIFKHNPIDNLLYNKKGDTASYWSGTILSIHDTRKLGFIYAGPTVIQVAISLISAIEWMLANPDKGICYPEELPYDMILNKCHKYLGKVFTAWVPYKPLSTQLKAFII